MKLRLMIPVFGILALLVVTDMTGYGVSSEKEVVYAIDGVFCSGCVAGLESLAEEAPGVVETTVDLEKRVVVVRFDETETSATSIRDLINEETTFDLSIAEVRAVSATKAGFRLFGRCC